ncbi:MAG: hypothetical protein H7Y60_04100 [Rhodospirillaceae bacterium]|nr:hypothetical protein [Rhodospirillales bacterium]
MTSDKDEIHHCPACNKRTRHRVSRERKLAPVLWCQSCFNIQVAVEEDQQQQAA